MKRVVITGGHHSSALPVIKELKKRNPEINIYWLGHKKTLAGSKSTTLEYREITALDIPFFNLHAGKFYKTFNLIRLLKIPFGFLQSLILLVKLKPDVTISFGGYLAVPVVTISKFLSIPSVTHEQTVVSGYANRLISKFADKVLYAWPQSVKYLPQEKSKLVGLPLREEIFSVNSEKYKLNRELPTIYITAGKTGSHTINQAIGKVLEDLLNNFNVIHQTGDHSGFRDYEKLLDGYKEINGEAKGNYYLEKFVYADTIGETFQKADFIISRSGAHICYEVLALEKPAIFLPIPWVSHNEQFKNAENVKNMGLAEIFEETRLQKNEFFQFIMEFSKNLGKYKLKEKPQLVKNSAEKIVNEAEEISKN